ncbi:outer membrane lipid asymmetry maintenance protein MlaD [Lichenicoccus sp.]|uniref:outer membrane lipid asymmetry maintenance protein MlaD n=1 Tax=Lichenicoccus sp. TaxID=2781899 RepID=UPI003D142391
MAVAEHAVPVRRRHDPVELLAGFVVLVVLAALITAAVIGNGRRSQPGYQLKAQFDHVDGLDVGSDVRMAGVTVGQVVSETVDPKSFQAIVTLTVRPDIKLPPDSSIVVTSDSLLGGKYLALAPGGADGTLPPGGRITQTQGSISLEQLLSKFIFTVTDTMTKQAEANKQGQSGKAAAVPGKSDDLPNR